MFKNHLFKIFFSLLLILSFSSFAFAQEEQLEKYPIEQGSILLSGALSFYTQVSPQNGVTLLTFSPSMLYFFINKLAVGPDLSFVYASTMGESSTGVGGGIKIGWYDAPLESKLLPFAVAGFKYISVSEISYFQIRGGLGINFLLGKNGTLFLQGGYQMDMIEGENIGTIFVESGLGIFLF